MRLRTGSLETRLSLHLKAMPHTSKLPRGFNATTLFCSMANLRFAIHKQLINSLFVVKICGRLDSPIPATAKDTILKASPLFAQGRYALANDYTLGFDPKNPFQFKLLVTITIRQGTPLSTSFSTAFFNQLDVLCEEASQLVWSSTELQL